MAEQLFQIGIKALIRNDQGDILMVHIPAWSGNEEHWDLPGGRMEPGESFLDTLKRELLEEIGVAYEGEPKQLAALRTHITIPVGDVRYPLLFVVYEAMIPKDAAIKLDPNGPEKEFGWFTPREAAELMITKFPDDFRNKVSQL